MINNQMMNMFQQLLNSNPQMRQMFNMARSMSQQGNPKQVAMNIMQQKGISIEDAKRNFINLGKQLGFSEEELNNSIDEKLK